MLLIEHPITLTADAGMTLLSDSFGERIRANYELMAARFLPKDLLFLLLNPPDAQPAEGMGGIEVENHFAHTQHIVLDVVNNVVNRLLLEDKSALSYQDRVYIDMALHKLGIENVAQFVTQIRVLREENLSIYRLLSLYGDNITRLSRSAEVLSPKKGKRRTKRAAPADTGLSGERRLYLQDEIYNRLGTARVYHTLTRLVRSLSERFLQVDRRELTLAEQSRLADVLTLQSYERQVFSFSEPAVTLHRSFYENGMLLPPPATENEVVGQAAAATLLQLADNVMVTKIGRYLTDRSLWLDIREAARHSSQNALSRFLSYHENAVYNRSEVQYTFAQQSRSFRREAETIHKLLHAAPASRQKERAIVREWETIRNERRALTVQREQTLLIHERAAGSVTPEQTAGPPVPFLSEYHTEHTAQERFETGGITERTYVAGTEPVGETASAPESSSVGQKTEETVLREALNEIDRRNRERLERVREVAQKTERTPMPQRPDAERIQRDALRALAQPDQVLAEALVQQRRMPATPEEARREALLSQTDETTRRMLESVLTSQDDPGQTRRTGVIFTDSVETFNREITALAQETREQTRRQDMAVRLVHKRTETRQDTDESTQNHTARHIQTAIHNTAREQTHESISERTQINQITQELAARTREDVTEMIDKALRRQLGVISDKVYTQLERRLQGERSRRGRF